MFKLNNKGQSLAMFVIVIPIFILVITLVYDVASAIYEKNRLSNTSYMVIDYGLNNIDNINEEKLIDLIMKNTKNLSYVSVIIDNNVIEVKLSKSISGVIGGIIGFELIEVNTCYEGKIVDKEKKIERTR